MSTETQYVPSTKPGPKPIYPWDKWFKKGTVWRLKQVKDYKCKTSSMIFSIRRKAWSRGLVVSVHKESNSCIVIVNKGKKK